MGMLNLKESEQIEAAQVQQKNNSGNRNLIIIVCVIIAFNYAWYIFDPMTGDLIIKNTLIGKFLDVLATATALLFLPVVISCIANFFTHKWQYIFGVVFLIGLLFNFAGRFAK